MAFKIHVNQAYAGHHWASRPSACPQCRSERRAIAREWEEYRGWRVRPVKGGGFRIERFVCDIGYTYPTRWVNLDSAPHFVASADAKCWAVQQKALWI